MSNALNQRELIVFPTELAMRRYQQDQALEHGWVNATGHTTFARLRQQCMPYIHLSTERMNSAQHLLLRKQVVEVASGHFAGHEGLGQLSSGALGNVLDKLIGELVSVPQEAQRISNWLLEQQQASRLWQLGMLFSVWRAVIKQEGLADPLDINHALLKLLKGNREKWPPRLRSTKQLTFRSVRWFTPFEESCLLALKQKMKVRVESALPAAHAEASGDKMGQLIRTEIMAEPWAVWAEDLGDALAVDSPDILQLEDTERIQFSRSAGSYGEIEDLARRIRWNLKSNDMTANRIALVVPNIGTVQDIVPHVFRRFQIPYYFRRGRPILSSPCVKAFFSWLAFPLSADRNTLIDLFRNPALRLDDREKQIEILMDSRPDIDLKRYRLFDNLDACSGQSALKILKDRIAVPEDHFNAEAIKALEMTCERMGEHMLPLDEFVDMLLELLENETIRPKESHEQGVWILNPHDAVGLDFDLVCFAGLNEGEFPGVPKQDALLNDQERYRLRKHLEGQGRSLPAMALPQAQVLFEQESVLFLTAMGMAKEQLVLSCQAVDTEGNEKGEGEYFRKLWGLAGWPVQDELHLSAYDQWRIGQLDEHSIFSNHIKSQQSVAPEHRIAMPGESFLPITPLPLCCAEDEALQAAVHGGTTTTPPATSDEGVVPPGSLEHLFAMLKIEAEREAYLDAPIHEREASVYCGHINGLTDKLEEWFATKNELSPTALEVLAQCRYIFFLEKILGLKEERIFGDTPDPLDRGSLIHSILKEVYAAIANGEVGTIESRLWAVKADKGWVKRREDGVDAIPLAVFVPEKESEYLSFSKKYAENRMDAIELGHPGIWAAERNKILEMILNFVRYDSQTCVEENRYPALFEYGFGKETSVELASIKLHGKIDRVDLIFEDTGILKKVRVLDYKGSSRSRATPAAYMEEIRHNLDCQLPVYSFAAQDYFFGAHNSADANAMTEAGYLFYERDYSKLGNAQKKSLISMDEPGLLKDFIATLNENIRKLKAGDFAVDPLIETYHDYQSICRTTAIDRDALESSS